MDTSGTWLEVLIWEERGLRCEYWKVAGIPHLRVFKGNELTHDERAPPGQAFERSEELRLHLLGKRGDNGGGPQ